ncbi:MAG: hypothetical protein JSV91_01930 [Phycisphaerales bacterium]|nr:MAG: hypothetical protein JSV91_01930 [Phycisphaerales bacterium]
MAQVEILSEKETAGGWSFEAQVLDDKSTPRRHRITLSWADYNLWSRDGTDEPARVAEAVLAFLLRSLPPGEIRATFDAASVRRRFDDADEQIPALIGRHT